MARTPIIDSETEERGARLYLLMPGAGPRHMPFGDTVERIAEKRRGHTNGRNRLMRHYTSAALIFHKCPCRSHRRWTVNDARCLTGNEPRITNVLSSPLRNAGPRTGARILGASAQRPRRPLPERSRPHLLGRDSFALQ